MRYLGGLIAHPGDRPARLAGAADHGPKRVIMPVFPAGSRANRAARCREAGVEAATGGVITTPESDQIGCPGLGVPPSGRAVASQLAGTQIGTHLTVLI
jgi:hypothetical protein